MRQDPKAVMMFAAGFGTRMKHLTRDKPKPMIPVAGWPLVDHALNLAKAMGCDPIIANLHYKPEILAQHLQPQGVTIIVEAPDILETGGGLRNALPLLGVDPVFTQNTDAIWSGPNPFRLLQEAWRPENMDALLMCVTPERAVGYQGDGDFMRASDGALLRGPGCVYGGIQIIKTDLLQQIKEQAFSLNVIWNMMQDQGRLHGLLYPGKWCDVGHPDGIILAEEMLRNDDV